MALLLLVAVTVTLTVNSHPALRLLSRLKFLHVMIGTRDKS